MSKQITKKIVLVLTVALMLTSLVGCGGGNEADVTQKDELIVATAYDAKSLDPHAVNEVAASNVMVQIYNSLLALDDNGELVPSLAESYEQVDDITYKFTIKKGVKFHNGEEMTVDDVVFSLQRAATSPAVANLFGDIDVDSFEIIDDATFSFKLKNPNTGFLYNLMHPGASVLCQKAVEEAGDNYAMNPVGTGPFKFVDWKKGDRIELERFEDYWGEKPAFKKMVIRAIPEATNRTIELESGGVDVAYEISANDIERIEENEDLQLTRLVDNQTQYLGFNNKKEPFNDVRVRQAIRYALDIPSIVETAWKGVGSVAIGPMSPNINYYNSNIKQYEYNVEKAKELLAEAGYGNGFKTKLWTNEKQERIDMATIIQSQLKEVGIEVEVEILEWGSYLEKLANGEQEMFIIGWTGQSSDPDLALYGPLSKETLGAGANFSFFENDRVNELLLQGRRMKDSPEREAIYYEIQEIHAEETPWIPLCHGEAVIGSQKYVKNLKLTPFGFHPLYRITFGE
ncbi:ABC transporter substrate-binding protein [Tepidimicrobium xylanilyticum]